MTHLLPDLALAYLGVGRPELAAWLTGATESASRVLGIPYPEPIPGAAEELSVVADLNAALGDRGFEKAHSEGAAMSLNQAVAAALEAADEYP